jgi:excisionase family DNA binding protein
MSTFNAQTIANPCEGKLAFSGSELARHLGISLRHLRRLDSSGHLPKPLRLGRSVRWPVGEIEAWLAAGAPERRIWESMKKGEWN